MISVRLVALSFVDFIVAHLFVICTQFFTLLLASCLSIGAPAPSSVFSVRRAGLSTCRL